jgi:hypothetical protein
MLVSCLYYSSTLKLEAICSFETSVASQKTELLTVTYLHNYIAYLTAPSVIAYVTLDDMMTDELERIWKEAVMA